MTQPSNLADVEALLAERDAVAGWLARLDGADSSVPPPVRERVRLDYQHRLDGVTQRLQGHGDLIAAKLAEDRAEQELHATGVTVAREALAEAQLRHMVGEYDSTYFEAERSRNEAEIERFEGALAAVSERIVRLEDVLSLIVAPATPTAESAASAPDVVAPPAEQSPTLASGFELDEDQIDKQLLAIFDNASELSEMDIELVESAPETPRPDRGPLSFRPGSGMPAEVKRAPQPAGKRADAPRRVAVTDEPPRSPPPIVAVPTALGTRAAIFDDDIVAAGPPPEASAASAGRVLRCAECGAMNKGSEWYCEKCGAELNAG